MAKNKLAKFGIVRARVWVDPNERGEYAHPSITLSGESSWDALTLRFQRNRIDHETVTAWRVRETREALRNGGMRNLDIGPVAYGLSYGARVDDHVTASSGAVGRIAKILAVFETTDVHHPDELCAFAARIETCGISVEWNYRGFDGAYHGDARGKLYEWAYGPEARRVIAADECEEAERIEARALAFA